MPLYNMQVDLASDGGARGNIACIVLDPRFERGYTISENEWTAYLNGAIEIFRKISKDTRECAHFVVTLAVGNPSQAHTAVLGASGIPFSQIIFEDKSRFTVECAIQCKSLLDPLQVEEICIVTSELHAARASLIFNRVFTLRNNNPPSLSYFFSPNGAEISAKILEVEKKREESLIQVLESFLERYGYSWTPNNNVLSQRFRQTKFRENLRFNFFAGNTIVSQVPTNTPQLQILLQAQDILKKSSIRSHFGFLPASSFHMTVYDVQAQLPSSILTTFSPFTHLWLEYLNEIWYQQHQDSKKYLEELFPCMQWLLPHVQFDAMTPTGQIIAILKLNDRGFRALWAFREEVYRRLNGKKELRGPFTKEKEFHITLAYHVTPIEDEAGKAELEKVRKEMNKLLSSKFGELELEPPRLTRFHDMSEFIPMNGEDNVSLLLAYDVNSGKAAAAHLSDFGRFLETKKYQWTAGWTSFAPFCKQSEAYYIGYKTSTGKTTLVNFKTPAVRFDVFWIPTFIPGISSVFITQIHDTYFANFYNKTTGDISVAHVIIEVGVSRLEVVSNSRILPGLDDLSVCGGRCIVGWKDSAYYVIKTENGFEFEVLTKVEISEKIVKVVGLQYQHSHKDSNSPKFFVWSQTKLLLKRFDGTLLADMSEIISAAQAPIAHIVQLYFGCKEHIAVYTKDGKLHFFEMVETSNNTTNAGFRLAHRVSHDFGPNFSHLIFLNRHW